MTRLAPTFERSFRILAIARGWFDGFAAARPASIDEGNGSHATIREQLSEVTEHLARLEDGKFRTLVPGRISSTSGTGHDIITERHDGGLVIITCAELERLHDGLTRNPGREDRISGRSTVTKILTEFRAEADLYDLSDNVPF